MERTKTRDKFSSWEHYRVLRSCWTKSGDTDLVVSSPGLHQPVEEEGGGAEEEADDPAEADGQLGVELGPENLGGDREHDGQISELHHIKPDTRE